MARAIYAVLCVHREDAAAWIISIFVRIMANK